MTHTYRIKTTRDGKHDLLKDGEWLETFPTKEAAEAEREHRLKFDNRFTNNHQPKEL